MKHILNGATYDIDNSIEIARWRSDPLGKIYLWITMCRTQEGAFFIKKELRMQGDCALYPEAIDRDKVAEVLRSNDNVEVLTDLLVEELPEPAKSRPGRMLRMLLSPAAMDGLRRTAAAEKVSVYLVAKRCLERFFGSAGGVSSATAKRSLPRG
jgi:hypothetical protein